MTLTGPLMSQHNAGSEPRALEFASNSCLNCCQELLCSTLCSCGKESVIGAGVVDVDEFGGMISVCVS